MEGELGAGGRQKECKLCSNDAELGCGTRKSGVTGTEQHSEEGQGSCSVCLQGWIWCWGCVGAAMRQQGWRKC